MIEEDLGQIEELVNRLGWTRHVPDKFVEQSLPNVSPAEYSEMGRTAPVFSLYRKKLLVPGIYKEEGVIFRVTKEEQRNPRNIVVTTGTNFHVANVMAAVKAGLHIPAVLVNYCCDSWFIAKFNAAEILRESEPTPALGNKGNPVTLSISKRHYKDREYRYYSIRINFKPAGIEWNIMEDFSEIEESLR